MTARDKDNGASPSGDRATHEPNPQAVSAVPVGIPSATLDWEGIARREYLSAIDWAGKHQEAMHYLSDLDAAVFLAAEYKPDMTIGDFFAASDAVKRSREYLYKQQYSEDGLAQAIEARSDKTGTGLAEGESAVAESDAP